LYSRNRLDFSWRDWFAALWYGFFSFGPESREKKLARAWNESGVAFSTVRAAWDVLLTELALPAGSRVICTAVNIPDMFQILRDHDLVPVPVDLNPRTMAVEPEDWAGALEGEVALVLVAHLLGTRADLESLFALCAERGIPVVEDCAQAFDGVEFTGDARSLATLFSFGPIKTQSALGGAVGIVRDPVILQGMRKRVSAYPRQSRIGYLGKTVKYGVMKFLTLRPCYAVFVRVCSWVGGSHDKVINGAVLGLKGDDYYRVLRVRPATPLLAMMRRRMKCKSRKSIETRQAAGDALLQATSKDVLVLGMSAPHQSWWQFCVVSAEPDALIERLRAQGFDATNGSSRLAPVEAPKGVESPERAIKAMENVVYVPAYRQIKPRDRARLGALLG
jgi:dTDP-4-amino-4,6-dideoxygalactose transaminase